jgi:lysozyme family protein
MLQQAVGSVPDGDFGPHTIACIQKYTAQISWAYKLIDVICDLRKIWYDYLVAEDRKDDTQFKEGWENRAADHGLAVPSMGLLPLTEVV